MKDEVSAIPSPICDLECERLVLASIMSSYHAMEDCEGILDEECFYNPQNAEIFSAAREVYQRGDSPDFSNINIELAKRNSGIGKESVIELAVTGGYAVDVYSRALRLQELSVRRKLWEIGVRLISGGTSETSEIEELQNQAHEALNNLNSNLHDNIVDIAQTYQDLQQQMLLNRDREPGTLKGSPTGFQYLDERGGLQGSNLIVVGAETSQGKTSFATAMTVAAIKHGDPVAFYSMEMTPEQLTARIASMQSGIRSSEIMNEQLSMNDIHRIDASMEEIVRNKLYFDGRSTSSADSIFSSIRRMKKKHGIKGAVIDYLQLVTIKDPKLNREQGIGKMAHDLKALAKELDIWIIAISQLSRNPSNPVPTLARLRDSGQIEEAADIVILIYRPQNGRSYPGSHANVSTEGTALINVAKGRNIGVGEFFCGFDKQRTLFYPRPDLSTISSSGESNITGKPTNIMDADNNDMPF